MQSYKSLVAAAASAVFLLAQTAAAQQNPATTSGAAPTGTAAKPATSEGTGKIAAPAPAKQTAAGSSARDPNSIHVEVNEVIVPVSVTDEKGRFVSDLSEKDFQIFEDNRPQTIRYFTRERNQPVVVGFLLDLSTASRIHWKNFQDATVELIQNLLTGNPKFSGYLITYAQDAELAVNTTTDPSPLVEKVRELKPGGGAALYDAIYLACTSRRWIKGEPIEPRRVIVIVGDGHDNASKYTLNQVIELAQRNLVTIYCISTQAFGFANESDDTLVRLAQETGGRVVYPLQDVYRDTDGYLSKPSDDGNYELTVGTGAYRSVLDNKMYRGVADVVGEITTQYILRYVSNDPAAKSYRDVKVVVDLGNVKVRARKGYYANAVPGAESAAASNAPGTP
jgi:Ca-activated chloride channel family protein